MAFKVDKVAELDRETIRESVIDRFSVERMTDGYEAIYRRMLASRGGGSRPPIAVMGEEAAATAGIRSGDPTRAAARS